MNGFFRFGNPFVKLPIKDRKIELLLDTGFNGCVMLPNHVIKKLELNQIGISDYTTASGETEIANVFSGKIKLFDTEEEIPIVSTNADFALAGMELFHDCKIVIKRSNEFVEVTHV